MRPLSRQRQGPPSTARYQTPQRTPQRFSKEHYLFKKTKQFTFDLSSSLINESVPTKRYLKPTIRILQLTQKMNKFKYLQLHLFEDSLFDKFTNQELLLKIQQQGPLNALILLENNHYEFLEGIITDYNCVRQEFKYQVGETSGDIQRLYFVCDIEDTKKYVEKFEKALQDREAMDSYLRYNYYIDNMQTQDIPELPPECVRRILSLIKGGDQSQISQINAHYKRVQNQLQFDEYLRTNKDILSAQLKKQHIIKKHQEFGRIQLNFKEIMIVHKEYVDFQPTSFALLKQQFIDVSLYTLPELTKAFFQISELNKQVCSMELLYWDPIPYSILLVKEKQDQMASRQLKQILKWSEATKTIMTSCIQELGLKNIELSQERLCRIIKVVRIKQQDSLQKLLSGNLILFLERLSKAYTLKNPVLHISVGFFGDFQYSFDILEIFSIYRYSLENELQQLSKIRDPECILNISDLMYLQCMQFQDTEITEFLEKVSIIIESINKQLSDHLKLYFKYRYVFEWQLNDFVRDCTVEEVFDLELFKKQIQKLQSLQLQLTKEISSTDHISIFIVDNSHLLFQINQLLEQNVREMIEHVAKQADTQVKDTILDFQKISLSIKKQSNDIIGLEKQRIFLSQEVYELLDRLQKTIKKALNIYEVLDQLSYISSHEQMKERWNLLSFGTILKQQIAQTLEELMEKRIQQKYDFQQDLLHFKYSIDDQERKVNNYIRHYSANSGDNQEFMKELLELKDQAQLMNQYEQIFNLPITNFGKIDFVIQSLSPLENLSKLLIKWNQNTWMQTRVEDLNAKEIQQFTDSSINELRIILQYATEKRMASIQQLTQQMLADISLFLPHLPLIFALTEPGMRERHWNQLSEKVGTTVPHSGVTLSDFLLFLDMLDSQNNINSKNHLLEISHIAEQELQIENTYNKLIQEYKSLTVQIIKPRPQLQSVQYNKLINLPNLSQKLDDHLCTLNILLQSKYHEPWKQDLQQLENSMIYSQTLIQQFEQLQHLFSYIFPVFQQSDLQKQLPIEVSRFKGVEKFWKAATSEFQQVHKYRNDLMQEQIVKLQTIEKSLANYIDKKREIFQRFHFLSNQQILLIQSRSTKPNEFINQLFAFNYVELDEDGITQLQIKNGKTMEHLDIQKVNIYSKNVEDWLHELIIAMRKALKQQIIKQQHCGQVKSLIRKIEWTYYLDNHFKDFACTNSQDLQQYKRLSAMEPDSFEYSMQLRYYINENQEIIIRFLNHMFYYDYEFFQENDYFIQTPQTDRCFANMAFAIGNHFGSFVYGNCGKIETIRQFSSCIGKYFVVMNANLSNYQVLTHLCKGVSATGTYFALTKCSEMRAELLSIFVQLIKVLFFATRNKVQLIDFEGQTVKINPSFSFFLIGDQLKTVSEELRHYFRPIYFQKLDVNIIIEYLSNEYQVQDSVTQLKQFLSLYSSVKKHDVSTNKLRQVFVQAKHDGMQKAVLKQFQEKVLQEIIAQIWSPQKDSEINLKYMLSEYNYILLFGPSLSGKSQQISKLEKTTKVYITSFSQDTYFGTFESEGILSEILNNIENSTLVIDGDVDEKLIEMLLPLVLFQQIRFPNGKMLQITNKIVFETLSIEHLSPNTVTRMSMLYLGQIVIDIPKYASHFICLSGIYKSPITKEQQLQLYKEILQRIKGKDTQEFEAVFAATWAFGSSLSEEHKLLLNRQIKEIWDNSQEKSVDPFFYNNLFDYTFQDQELVELVGSSKIEKIKGLLEYIPHLILFGETGSGKSSFLKQPFLLDMRTSSVDILEFLQGRLKKKRNKIFSIGRLYIDDLHLPVDGKCIEFLRQLADNNGYHNVGLTDLQMIVTMQHLKPQRILRYFLPLYCEPHSHQTIFDCLQHLNIPDPTTLIEIFKQSIPFFVNKHLKITHYDLWRATANTDPCWSLLQSIFYKIDDENLKVKWINDQKNFKIDEMDRDYSIVFQNENLVQFEINTMLLNYLIKLQSQKVIIYGPFGVGKKTLAKLACLTKDKSYSLVDNKNHQQTLILDDPGLQTISQLVNREQEIMLIITNEKLLHYTAKTTFLYKFAFVHHGPWPEEVFSDSSYAIYKYMQSGNYVTFPKLYLDHVLLQNRLSFEKQSLLEKHINQLSQGLQLLYSAQQAINQMNCKLTQIQPILESAVKDTNEIVAALTKQKQVAKITRDLVVEDEKIASEEQNKATHLSEVLKEKVQIVNQELDETLSEIQKLKKDHLVEIKSLLQPPKAVRVVLGGVVILLQDQIKYTGNMDDYFEISKKYLLNDVKELLDILKNYNKGSIQLAYIQQLESKIICDSDFTLERAKQCSLAVKYLFCWVKAIYDYHKVFSETQPLRDLLVESQNQLEKKSFELEEKRKELQNVTERLESYEFQVKEKQKIKVQLEQQIEDCQTRIGRSVKLIEGFKEEQKRWTTMIYKMKGEETRNEGDSVIASAIITYAGPLTKEKRRNMYEYLWKYLSELESKFTEQCTLNMYLSDEEDFIKENANILKYKNKPALFIDPQGLGMQYIKQKYNYKILNDVKKIQQYQQLKQLFCVDVSNNIQLLVCDINVINISSQYEPIFDSALYLDYQIVNFTITSETLVEKLLKCLTEVENPSLELKKEHNLILYSQDKNQLDLIEQQILHILQNKTIDNLLSEETLVNELHNSKIIYEETSKRIEMSKRLNEEIDVSRDQYRLLAQQISQVYFTVSTLHILNPLYNYSLDWFLQQLIQYCGKIERSNQIALNIQSIKQQFFRGIINEVGQLLTEEHKLIFCFSLAIDILSQRGLISEDEIDAFLGKRKITKSQNNAGCNPCIFIDDSEWPAIKQKLAQLNTLTSFQGILEDIEDHPNSFKQLYLHQTFTTEQQHLTSFQKLLLTNAFRPDKAISMMINLIEQVLQLKYTANNKMDLTNQSPLLVVGDTVSQNKVSLTLGEGQNQKVEKVMREAIENGSTVELLNCQFGCGILTQLENLLDEKEVHQNFKLILQLQQCDDFPITWLHRSTKIGCHKPTTLIDQSSKQINQLQAVEHPRFFSLNLFHAIMNLRDLFSFWPYRFHITDLELMMDERASFQKEMVYLAQFPEEDAELFNTLYSKTICQQSLREGFIYMGGELKMIKTNRDGYLQYFSDLGQINDFNCIGLNSNTQIIVQSQTMQRIQSSIQLMKGRVLQSYDIYDQLEKLERYTPLRLTDIAMENMIDLCYEEEKSSFNKLIDSLVENVKSIQTYLRGGDLDDQIEQVMNDLKRDIVPETWLELSKIKETRLSLWLSKVFEKGQFLSKWSSLKCFNLSFLSNPQYFLKLVKFQYAKQMDYDIETIEFKQVFLKEHHLEIEGRPDQGVYISGLRVSGARYNEVTQKLKALGHLEFYSDLPVVHLIPTRGEEMNYSFNCPVMREQEWICNLHFNTQDPLILLSVKITI